MNLDKKTTEYIAPLGHIKLSDSSRIRIKNNLREYVRFHAVVEGGVRVGEASRSLMQVPPRTSFITYILKLHPKSMTAALLALMLLVGGGTSYAAAGSVPGDFLYPVKVDVNENIGSAFAISDVAEANLQVHLAEVRMQEAETLAAQGKLTASAATDLDTRLKSHYDSAASLGAAVEAKGDYTSSATVRASLEGELRTHAAILSDLNTRIAGNSGASLVTNIGLYAGMAASAQTAATATVKTSVDAKAMTEASLNATDALLVKVQTNLRASEAKLSADVAASAKVKMAKAITLETEAKASFTANAYSEAYATSQNAIRLAIEVDSLIKSTLQLPLNTSIHIGGSDNTTLDLHGNTASGTETNDGVSTGSQSGIGVTATSSTGTTTNLDVKGEIHTDTINKTGVIDSSLKTDTTVETGLGI